MMQFIQLIPDFKKTFIKKIYLSGLIWSDLYQHFDILELSLCAALMNLVWFIYHKKNE